MVLDMFGICLIQSELEKFPVRMVPRARIQLRIQELPDLLTVREVADVLRVSPLTIKRWGKRGKLPAIRINSRGDRRYKKEAVLYLLGIQPPEGG